MRNLGLQLEGIAPTGDRAGGEFLMAGLEREFASIQPRMEELRRRLVDSAGSESGKEEL